MATQFLPTLDDDARARVCRVQLDIDRSLGLMLGQEMVEWVDAGEYPMGDRQISLPATRGAGVSIPPEAHVPVVQSRPERMTRVEVANESSLTAARRLSSSGLSPLVLNMANGATPGGGFLHGSIAQEEYLCRSTALYATIRDDLSRGARLAGAGLRRASGQPIAAEEQARLKKEYESVWLRRSRPGGLAESVAGLFG